MNPTKSLLSLLLLGVLQAPLALALPEDREQPIRITADRAELDDQKGIATYSGRVKVIQGSLEIEGDQVTIHSDDSGVNRIIALGQPARFRQQSQPDAPLDKGYALRIDYQVAEDEVTLEQEARLVRDRDIFTGRRIHLDIERDLVSAFSGDGPSDDRVRMILQPKKENSP